ncbi:aldo/keto reductase [Pseudanabaena sp. FACHB-2040]|uniref:aldo/keto reductase n=1 Tax=Pseudanabaena sp. FACHB-2040 TaxID=2692859 RepID=UPI0016872BA2|nr:aldo/keto reductase [Pseudanabaena sp. FACHB-2040]MBD2258298.1 aldo/keto reductase [Pseudanabaena sp. FACHB-2040]
MQYKLLGATGLRVSELCLGAMTFGEDWDWGANRETSQAIFEAFAEAGGNFIDTANIYTNGTSEKMLGELVGSERDRFVIATKYTMMMNPDDPNSSGNQRKNLMRSLEASLKRLNTDYIDLYWVHMWDTVTPIEETMRALDDVVRSGKVMYIGISDAPAWIISRAQTLAELKNMTTLAAVQLEYNLVERTVERDLLPMAEDLNLSILDWSPLGGGVLTGKYLNNDSDQDNRLNKAEYFQHYKVDRAMQIAQVVVDVAREVECSAAQVALAWIRQQSPRHIPIIGARSLAHLKDNLGCLDITLSDDQLMRLHAASEVDPGFALKFLRRLQNLFLGAATETLDLSLHPTSKMVLDRK